MHLPQSISDRRPIKSTLILEDSGSSVEDVVLAIKKAVKVLPAKIPAKKQKENNQDEVVKLLGVIVTNQKTLVDHHIAESDLSKALSLFKAKYLKIDCSEIPEG